MYVMTSTNVVDMLGDIPLDSPCEMKSVAKKTLVNCKKKLIAVYC